ncbi:isoprenoid biosynthesis glyoxalase ElbB [Alcanivorax quisquiliarum]|uniref:Glyoxalase n=1 Tax=Alcanivorax quisquiliarum TaxID=2933565 RepID=A0ABT0EAD8_9GAMM|nr:isoprenoid biosynthesis glyoxalase ElbB [Alcanivorax quisquiliarum]MCK0538805.1 isoprenoid biosynthesis glyoxalase ElbB [Alcanivorax quisquiliarum]
MKIAVLLAGSGVFDGSEIYETTLALLALDRADVSYQCMAPNIAQAHVINHITGEEMPGEKRNVLVESARLARGAIIDLSVANAEDYDALIVPGGFGVAKNLCNFAFKGAEMEIDLQVRDFIREVHQAGKPVGLICIAPTMAAQLFGEGTRCTIGSNAEVAAAIEEMGGQHVQCPVDEFVVDEEKKLVTTPAYMEGNRLREAAAGIEKLVAKVIELAN